MIAENSSSGQYMLLTAFAGKSIPTTDSLPEKPTFFSISGVRGCSVPI